MARRHLDQQHLGAFLPAGLSETRDVHERLIEEREMRRVLVLRVKRLLEFCERELGDDARTVCYSESVTRDGVAGQ